MRLLCFVLLFWGFGAPLTAQDRPVFNKPIGPFDPERVFPPELIVERSFLETNDFVQYIAAAFECDEDQLLAILVNGGFIGSVRCNGRYSSDAVRQEVPKKVKLGEIERIVAQYNPHFMDPTGYALYYGTMNFVVNPMPNFAKAQEPPIEPWIQEALANIANRPKSPIGRGYASTKLNYGFVGGGMIDRGSFFLGGAIEVPMTSLFSVESYWTWNNFSETGFYQRPDNVVGYSRYNFNALETNFLIKAYAMERYPRVFAFTGPLVEVATNKWGAIIIGNTVRSGNIRQRNVVMGGTVGAGIAFQSGFNFWVSYSNLFPFNEADFLYRQSPRGVSFGLGWRIFRDDEG